MPLRKLDNVFTAESQSTQRVDVSFIRPFEDPGDPNPGMRRPDENYVLGALCVFAVKKELVRVFLKGIIE